MHTRYSPVRRSPPKYCYLVLPLDLHVLSLPLAFILSQDQTLHCKNLFLSLFTKINPCLNSKILTSFFDEIFLISSGCTSKFQRTLCFVSASLKTLFAFGTTKLIHPSLSSKKNEIFFPAFFSPSSLSSQSRNPISFLPFNQLFAFKAGANV